MKTKLTWMLVGVAVFGFLFWHPRSRPIIWAILPFGRNWDDVIFIIVAATLLILAFARGWIEIPSLFKK